MLTVVAFLVALGVLIAVHEWGHYRMAVACGVKVLRFSVGFGKAVLRFKPKKQRPGQDTEFVIGLIPFGGFVKMLDGREGEVPEGERHLAFDAQPLRSRALIVAAGPVANLVLAVLLYAAVNWIGQLEPRAVLAPPLAGSLAERAGLQGGEVVRAAALAGHEAQPMRSFASLYWLLINGAIDGQDVLLQLEQGGGQVRDVTLPLAGFDAREFNPNAVLRAIGTVPLVRPQISELVSGDSDPAVRAGLQAGDVVLKVGQVQVTSVGQLINLIHDSVSSDGQPRASTWEIERAGRRLTLEVLPGVKEQHGWMGIGLQDDERDMVRVRYGPLEGLTNGARKTWDMSALSLRLLGRMVVGRLSVKNLSGPIAIADFAGRAARMGLVPYIGFLAFISVSLGVFNLLPVPVLDGGQLMYYLWEKVTGKPVAGVWFDRLQYVGLAMLLAVMAIAVFNDIASRLG